MVRYDLADMAVLAISAAAAARNFHRIEDRPQLVARSMSVLAPITLGFACGPSSRPFILISCLAHSRNSFPIFREDRFGFRDQLSHKFGCLGRMAKTCVLTRPDCHQLQSSLSGSGRSKPFGSEHVAQEMAAADCAHL